MSSGNDSDTNNTNNVTAASKKGINVPINFPRMAKFIETVTPPDFSNVGSGKLGDGRMYEEEVPKAKVRFFFLYDVCVCDVVKCFMFVAIGRILGKTDIRACRTYHQIGVAC